MPGPHEMQAADAVSQMLAQLTGSATPAGRAAAREGLFDDFHEANRNAAHYGFMDGRGLGDFYRGL